MFKHNFEPVLSNLHWDSKHNSFLAFLTVH